MKRWTFDSGKEAANRRKHKQRKYDVDFDLAERVFGDPAAATSLDPHPDGDRYITVGKPSADHDAVLVVVHTEPEEDDEGNVLRPGRIISARKATPYERKQYEEG